MPTPVVPVNNEFSVFVALILVPARTPVPPIIVPTPRVPVVTAVTVNVVPEIDPVNEPPSPKVIVPPAIAGENPVPATDVTSDPDRLAVFPAVAASTSVAVTAELVIAVFALIKLEAIVAVFTMGVVTDPVKPVVGLELIV